MDPKQKGRLLTATFQRMNTLGIVEFDDIIATLAEEIEGYREKIKQLGECRASGVEPAIRFSDIPDALMGRLSSMDVSPDGSVSLYFNGNECTILYADGTPTEINIDGKSYNLCSGDDGVSPPPSRVKQTFGSTGVG